MSAIRLLYAIIPQSRKLSQLGGFLLSQFLIALSITSLTHAILFYHGIELPNYILWIIFGFYLYITYRFIDIKYNLPSRIDILLLIPLIVIYIVILPSLTQLPLADDIRYTSYSYVAHNGTLSLIGYIVMTLNKILIFTEISISYWTIVFITISLYYLLLIDISRSIFGLKGYWLYLAVYASIFTLNLLPTILFNIFINKPYDYTPFIWRENGMAIIGRSVAEPNILKLLAIIFVFLGNYTNHKTITALLYVLAYITHPVYAIFAIPIGLFLNNKQINIKSFLFIATMIILIILLLGLLTHPAYYNIIPMLEGYLAYLGGVTLVLIILLSIVIQKCSIYLLSNKNYILIYLILLAFLPLIFSSKTIINQNYVLELKYLIFYNYYIIIGLIFYILWIVRNNLESAHQTKFILNITIYYFIFLTIIIITIPSSNTSPVLSTIINNAIRSITISPALKVALSISIVYALSSYVTRINAK